MLIIITYIACFSKLKYGKTGTLPSKIHISQENAGVINAYVINVCSLL